jgi:hypothetical protein
MKNLPPLVPDAVIEAYKKDVDRTLLRENLKLTYEERLMQLQQMAILHAALSSAGRAPSPTNSMRPSDDDTSS